MIKATSDTEVRGLIDAIAADDPARRQAAMARLTIIGDRAVGRVVAACAARPSRTALISLLQVLEGVPDERALATAKGALREGGDVAVAAVGVLRSLLAQAVTQVDALDALLEAAADGAAEHRVRAAAAEALSAAPEDVRRAVRDAVPPAPRGEEAVWEDAVAGRLPDDPSALRDALADRAAAAPLPVLRTLIEAVRARERAEAAAPRREPWCALRGALHQAAALRGSRVALYDLRETLADSDGPLPAAFLAAVHAIGDASCLEALARAHARARPGDARWRHQLAQAFAAIIRREKLTTRHAAVRQALARAPALAQR